MRISRALILAALLGTCAAVAYGQRAEGSARNPTTISVDTPHRGSVDTGESYYSVAVEPGVRYQITLDDMSDDADLFLYGGDASFEEYTQVSDSGSTELESAVTQSSSRRLYLIVDGQFTDSGTEFWLTVTEFRGDVFVDEGSRSSPVLVRVDEEHSGSVGTGTSYYRIRVQANSVYEILLSGLVDDADIEVFADDSYEDLLGSSANGGESDEEFRVASVGSELYIAVDGGLTDRGSPLRLLAVKLRDALPSEGSRDDPVRLRVGSARAGSVSTDSSYYWVAVEAGLVYRVELTDLEDDADLEVYHDARLDDYAGGASRGGSSDDIVDVIPKTDSLYLVVDGSLTDAGTPLSIRVVRGGEPPRAEGRVTIEPVRLTIGVPHDGEVNTGRSYYAVSVTPGIVYDISLSGMTADGDLYIHDDDPTYAEQQASSTLGGADDDDSVQVEAGGRLLHISVDGSNTNIGTRFQILVTDRGVPTAAEGGDGTPVTLTIGRPRRGQVDASNSVYLAQTTPGREYQITLDDASDDIDLYVYADEERAEELASSFNPELEPEQVTVVAPGRRLVIVADGSYTSTGGTFTVLIAEAQGR